jgi:hypothetical protein
MARRTALVLMVLCLVMPAGCGGSPNAPVPLATPSPAPTATPRSTSPWGRPNATALDNLALIDRLERQRFSDTRLVMINGVGIGLDGRVREGNGWTYRYASGVGNDTLVHDWTARDTGEIEYRYDPRPATNDLDPTDIEPHLAVDSPRLVSLALGYGAQGYADRWPNTLVRLMKCSFMGRRPTWEIEFADRNAWCELPIYLQADTGGLLFRDLWCVTH